MLSTSEGFLLGLRLRVRAHAGGLRPGEPWARCGQGLLPPSPAPGLRMAWLWLSPRVPILTWSCCPSLLGSILDRAKRAM